MLKYVLQVYTKLTVLDNPLQPSFVMSLSTLRYKISLNNRCTPQNGIEGPSRKRPTVPAHLVRALYRYHRGHGFVSR